jgi:hypothetical protein
MAKITDKAVLAIIAELEAELNDAAMLAKAEPEGPPAESTDDSASPPADESEGESAPPAGPPADSAPAPEAPSAPAASPEAPPASPEAPMDPAAQGAQGPMDPAALQAEYAQLPPDQLDMHIQAAMAAKEALAGAASAGAPPMASPMAPPAPAASPAPAGAPPMMGKNEIKTGKENGGMVKSEVDVLRAELADLKKSLTDKNEDVELLTKAVKMVIEKPSRKAVTSVSQLQYLGKSEAPVTTQKTFTKAEAEAKLTAVLPSLTKSERDLVVQYSLGRVQIGALESILDKASK